MVDQSSKMDCAISVKWMGKKIKQIGRKKHQQSSQYANTSNFATSSAIFAANSTAINFLNFSDKKIY